jgi:hypothetical protein
MSSIIAHEDPVSAGLSSAPGKFIYAAGGGWFPARNENRQ